MPIDILMVSKKPTIQIDKKKNDDELLQIDKSDIRKALNDIETPATFRKKAINDIPTHRRRSSNLPVIDLENKQLMDQEGPSRNVGD